MKTIYALTISLLASACTLTQAQNVVYPATQSTSGAYNAMFGTNAGLQNTGNSNVMVGYNAGNTNTTGGNNTYMGNAAGWGSTTGSYNTCLGSSAGSSNGVGSENTFIGAYSGPMISNSTPPLLTQSTLLGRYARAANGLTNASAIGYNAYVGASNALILGNTSVNVGIGTSAPSNKLHVVGDEFVTGKIGIGTNNFSQDASVKLIVDGKILAEEVEVKNVSADHVFSSRYKLRSLAEVEHYINSNQHLPDVPAASETEKGVQLAAFNTLLLQKIEELTLYVIQQQKQLEQQNELTALKSRRKN